MTFRRNPALRPVLGAAAALAAAAALFALPGCTRTPKIDSVLLITIDTLRADHVSAYGASPVQTPVLDKLAQDGARVERAWTTVPLTTPAHASILSGLYPPTHGVRNNARFRLPDDVNTLAEILRANGRRTGGFVASFTTASTFGLGQGFETFDDDLGQDDSGARRAQRPAFEVVGHALKWLESHKDEPFFLWVHMYDPHMPYTPLPKYAAMYPGDPYSGEVAQSDGQVGRLVAALAKAQLDTRTVVIALADHGEGLSTHGEPEHGVLLYEETLRVPLVLRAPGRIAPGTVIGGTRSTIDVAPTVLDLLGLPVPAEMQGRTLLAPVPADRTVYAETLYPYEEFGWSALYALRAGEHKLIAAPRPELYDLAQDPKETKDLAAAQAATVGELGKTLRAVAAQAVNKGRLAAAAGFGGGTDPETIARLESLGYVAGGGGGKAGGDDALPAIAGPNPMEMTEDLRLFERAGALAGSNQADAAAAIYEKLAARDPGNPQLLLKLAAAADKQGNDRKAEEAYRALIARHATFYLGTRSFSDFLEKRGRARESRELWLRLQGLLPGYVGIDVRIAQAETAAGIPAEAARRMGAYLDARPDDADAWAELGKARLALGKPDEALEAYRRAVALVPTHRAAVEAAVSIFLKTGRKDEARGFVDALLKRQPDDPLLVITRKAL